MLKSSRQPYQTTTFTHTAYPVRNPWIEKVESSTNSSCGSRSGHNTKQIVPQPTEWPLPGSQPLSHLGPLLNQQVHPVVVQTHAVTESIVSVGQGSSGVMSVNGKIGSCGGQCIACETFCYYCLQVIFIAGILTGIALTIAGSVLHENQREGDLVVLLYIGVLLVLVCILLLSVHCCVRRNVKERKRALRMTLMESPRREVSGDFSSAPVPDFTAEHSLRNSHAETVLNDFDIRENLRPLFNTVPNSLVHYQKRIPTNHIDNVRVHSCERCLQGLNSHDQQAHEWCRISQPGPNRLFR